MEYTDVAAILYNYNQNDLGDEPFEEDLEIIELEKQLKTFYDLSVLTELTATGLDTELCIDYIGSLDKRRANAIDLVSSLNDFKDEVIKEIPKDKITHLGYKSILNGNKIFLFEFIENFKTNPKKGNITFSFNGKDGYSDQILEKLAEGAFFAEFLGKIDAEIRGLNSTDNNKLPENLKGLWSIWNNADQRTLINIYNDYKNFVRPSGADGSAKKGEKQRLYCLAYLLNESNWIRNDGTATELATIFNDTFGFKSHTDDYLYYQFYNQQDFKSSLLKVFHINKNTVIPPL